MATDNQRAKVLQSLKNYKKRYIKKQFSELDESATRIMINSFLTEVLGYEELNEIKTEYAIKGVYADYVIQLQRKKQFVVEVKSIQLDLNERHLHQSIGYAANEGIDWIILTNGRCFQFYRLLFEKPIRSELVASIEFTDTTPAQLKGSADFIASFTKRGVLSNEHETLWQRSIALSPHTISKILYSEEVAKQIRRELKSSTNITFEIDAIRLAIKNTLEQKVDTEKIKFKIPKLKPLTK
jgi:predicted type IV restriction endonuclease